MMRLVTCEICGAVHVNHANGTCCPDCLTKELEIRDILRSYIVKHPMPSILELSSGTGVRPDVILRFVRNGSLSLRV